GGPHRRALRRHRGPELLRSPRTAGRPAGHPSSGPSASAEAGARRGDGLAGLDVAGGAQPSFQRVAPGDPEATVLLHGYRDELRARLAPAKVVGLDGWDATFGPPGGMVVVARVEDRPVACVGLRALGPGVGELKHFFVTVDARGRGLARALLAEVERLA